MDWPNFVVGLAGRAPKWIVTSLTIVALGCLAFAGVRLVVLNQALEVGGLRISFETDQGQAMPLPREPRPDDFTLTSAQTTLLATDGGDGPKASVMTCPTGTNAVGGSCRLIESNGAWGLESAGINGNDWGCVWRPKTARAAAVTGEARALCKAAGPPVPVGTGQ